jgi:ATP-binding cassette, subfamily B (MDR/TAP), member 1
MLWATRLCSKVFKLHLAQDKKYFDHSVNSLPSLVQIFIKNGDDTRNLIAVVLAQVLSWPQCLASRLSGSYSRVGS